MRVLIFGANGMLGHKLYQRLGSQFQLKGTIRGGFDDVAHFGIFSRPTIIEHIDVTDAAAVELAITIAKPDVVVNAVGVIKQLPNSGDVIRTLSINSIFPNRLSELGSKYKFRTINISTDCVFDGAKGNYSEHDIPDARDLYGLSKLLGEIKDSRSLTIRTSIIGRELSTRHSIVEWFLSQRGGELNGYTKAIYSGFPTSDLADLIAFLIEEHPYLSGLFHVSSDPISKFEMLNLLNISFETKTTIRPSEDVIIDRSLDSTEFRSLTGFKPLAWDEMIARMATDETPYDNFQ